MVGRIQARERFPGAQLPATGSSWAEASHWACDALNRTATPVNPSNKSPYEMWYGSTSLVVLLPFLKPGCCKVKRENKSQAKEQEHFYLDSAPNHPRDAVRVLTKHRVLLVTRHVTWQRVSPAPFVPAQMHDSLSQEAGGSESDDESTADRGGRGVMDEQDEVLNRLTDLDVTWRVGLHAFSWGRSQETPVAGNAGDRTVKTMDSSQGGAVDASSVPAWRAETVETMDTSQGGTMPARSRQRGPEATQADQQPPAPTKGTAMIPPRSCRGGQLTRSVAGDGYPRQ